MKAETAEAKRLTLGEGDGTLPESKKGEWTKKGT